MTTAQPAASIAAGFFGWRDLGRATSGTIFLARRLPRRGAYRQVELLALYPRSAGTPERESAGTLLVDDDGRSITIAMRILKWSGEWDAWDVGLEPGRWLSPPPDSIGASTVKLAGGDVENYPVIDDDPRDFAAGIWAAIE